MRKFIYGWLFLFIGSVSVGAQSYDNLWKEVEACQKKDLPQSVISAATAIYEKAKTRHDAPQMMKAYLTLTQARYQISPDSLETDLTYLKQWAETEKDSVNASVLYSILGEMVMTKETHEEAISYLLRSLQPVEALGACSASKYVPLTEEGKASVLYEENKMYPMLAHRAIALLTENRYSFSYDVIEEIVTGIYRSLREYFLARGLRAAYVLLTSNEINSKRDMSLEECLAAYQGLIEQYGDVETCAEVCLSKAQKLRTDKPKEAYDLLESAVQNYTGYQRINALKEEMRSIAAPQISVKVNPLYPGKSGSVEVSYRNMSGFTIKIYRTEVSEIGKVADYQEEDSYWKDKWHLYHTVHYALEPTPDYNDRDTTFTITIPEEGYYLLEALPEDSYTGDFKSEKEFVYVSAYSMMMTEPLDGKRKAMVVDRMSGAPIKEAIVECYIKENGEYILDSRQITDSCGLCSWNEKKSSKMYVRAITPDHTCMPLLEYRNYRGNNGFKEEYKDSKAVLFADRNIYRPGQTVYVSGIVYAQEGDSLNVKKGEKIELVWRNANGKQIGESVVQTNEFGSFHTSFVLPSVCLSGRFSVMIKRGYKASLGFRVEEYKRPTFEVKLEKVQIPYMHGDTVWIHGKAEMYTGMPVQHAKVNYRINAGRNVWLRNVSKEENGRVGTVQTDEAGTFSFPIVIPQKEQCTNSYDYSVEVTTEGGDVQSAGDCLKVGDLPYQTAFSGITEVWIKEHAQPIALNVTNYNRYPIDTEIQYEVFDRLHPKEKSCCSGRVRSNKYFVPEAIYDLPSGSYRIKATVKDGQVEQNDSTDFFLISLSDNSLPAGLNTFLYTTHEKFENGVVPEIYFGTSLKDVHVFGNVCYGNGKVETRCFELSDSIRSFSFPYTDEWGDGVAVCYAFVKEGKIYMERTRITKPEPDKKLVLQWRTFRDKLQVGNREEWRLRIMDAEGKSMDSELLATLYDASLDQLCHRSLWTIPLYFRRIVPNASVWWTERWKKSLSLNFLFTPFSYTDWTYTHLVLPLPKYYETELLYSTRSLMRTKSSMAMRVASPSVHNESEELLMVSDAVSEENETSDGMYTDSSVRTNFAETAFFYPQLHSNEKGEVDLAFTLPESVTTWRFMGLAHTREMDYGAIDTMVVASKIFMLQANLPRFVRVGDFTSLGATLSNISTKKLSGTVCMELYNPVTGRVFYKENKPFQIGAGGTTFVSFEYEIPDTCKIMACRMVAEGGGFSDGEQHLLPVLSNREWITESVAFSMNKSGTQTIELDSLFNKQSATASDLHLTVEFMNNPAWMAVLALPSIGNPSDQNAVSLSAAYYSATLALWLIERNPRIRAMFDTWKAKGNEGDIWKSELQKNPELKELLLECSPFVDEAETEADQHYRLALLFDANTLQGQMEHYLDKLKELQTADGGWGWYKGMSSSTYMTLSVVETLLRLQSLTGEKSRSVDAMTTKAMEYLDKEIVKLYEKMRDEKFVGLTSEFGAHYLYVAMLSDKELKGEVKTAYDYLLEKLKNSSSNLTIYGKAVAAMVLYANGAKEVSADFVKSLLEYSVCTKEMGRYYDSNIAYYSWADYRIPTQTVVIEALRKLGESDELIAQFQQWLLKQKQVQSWNTPVNTVNAIYALLTGNSTFLSDHPMPELYLDDIRLSTEEATIGMGAIKKTMTIPSVAETPKSFSIRKEGDYVSWGAVYAQYSEAMNRVTSQSEGLFLARTLFIERIEAGKAQWVEWKEGEVLHVGDKIKSVLQLKSDRDMDFVQLKESRAACMEPVATMSGYRYEKGVGYYRAIKDSSTEYYMDHLRKGSYTFETLYYVMLEGLYETGIAKAQSAYAPSFNAHTNGQRLKVEK